VESCIPELSELTTALETNFRKATTPGRSQKLFIQRTSATLHKGNVELNMMKFANAWMGAIAHAWRSSCLLYWKNAWP